MPLLCLPAPAPVAIVRTLPPQPSGAIGSEGQPFAASRQQQRELDSLHEMTRCNIRRSILFALGIGPAHVNALAARSGIARKSLSHHLAFLHNAGLVYRQRQGRSICYELAPNRVRLRQRRNGRILLRILDPTGEVWVTLTINPKTPKAKESTNAHE